MGQLVVLAYSGGLDTSAIVPWLKEHYDARVLCYAADVGQGDGELAGLEAKAVRSGAIGCVVDDLRERFVTDFVFPTLKAGAVDARTYLLGTSIARPVIAAGQVAGGAGAAPRPDRHLGPLSHEGGIREAPAAEPSRDLFLLPRDPADAPDSPEE